MKKGSPTMKDYSCAVELPGLEPVRARQLVAHIASRNSTLADRPPVSEGVARCAAALLLAEPVRLASPTALAQAEALATVPALGPALMNLQAGALAMAGLDVQTVAAAGPQRSAARHILRHLIAECSTLLNSLERSDL